MIDKKFIQAYFQDLVGQEVPLGNIRPYVQKINKATAADMAPWQRDGAVGNAHPYQYFYGNIFGSLKSNHNGVDTLTIYFRDKVAQTIKGRSIFKPVVVGDLAVVTEEGFATADSARVALATKLAALAVANEVVESHVGAVAAGSFYYYLATRLIPAEHEVIQLRNIVFTELDCSVIGVSASLLTFTGWKITP